MRFTDTEALPCLAGVRTLVVPTVSAANVPQLAIDLFVHTHALARVATVVDAAVMPAVGADALGAGAQSLSTACELFCDSAGSVALLQMRAPLAPGTGPAFVRRVHAWASHALGGGGGAARVIWLHASLAEEVGSGGPAQAMGLGRDGVEYALSAVPPGPLAAALGALQWQAVLADDPRQELGHPVRGLVDVAAGGALEVGVLSVTVAEWTAVQDCAILASSLSELLAALAAADGAAQPTDACRKVAMVEWRQPPAWMGLLL
jgi:hypothetical protein